jgi:hypothetical protein
MPERRAEGDDMLEQFRRTVTGFDADGRSVFVSQEVLEPVTTPLYAETYWKVWGTPDGVPQVGGDEPYRGAPHFPGPGGSRIVVVRFPAQGGDPTPVAAERTADEEAILLADAEVKFPGLLDSHEAGSRFHTSDTVDYALVIDGELTLELDDGAVETLKAGSFVVQRGTRHAWRNDSHQAALVLFVVLGAERV